MACTALRLLGTKLNPIPRDAPFVEFTLATARHAVTLHRISGQLHRLSERACNEDLTCPKCVGEGESYNGSGQRIRLGEKALSKCRACAGHGTTTGRRLERLRTQAQEIATHYGLRCYFQTDPRGCSLYLIDPAIIPDEAKLRCDSWAIQRESVHPTAETLQARWIEANYTRGHAVVRLGR